MQRQYSYKLCDSFKANLKKILDALLYERKKYMYNDMVKLLL